MRSPPRLLLYASHLAVVACKPPSTLQEWSGENFDYISTPSLEVCGGTHRQLDEFIGFFASDMGITTPSGITYTWLVDAGAKCREGLKGCAHGKDAFSETPAYPHELVHAVAEHSAMDTWPFFAEGLAVAYDPWQGEYAGTRYLLPAADDELLADPRPYLVLSVDEVSYDVAGSFVAFLLSRHGPAPFMGMTQGLPAERDLDALREVFKVHYPTTLDTEADLFMMGTDCSSDAFPILVYDCTAPDIAWDTESAWQYRRVIDCADEDVSGGYKATRSFASVHSVTLDVPSSGAYTLQVASDSEVIVQLGACFGCPWEQRGGVVSGGMARSMDIEAGPYFLRIVGSSTASPNVQVDLFQQ